MKIAFTILLFTCVVFPVLSQLRQLDNSGNLIYEATFEIPGLSRKEIIVRANKWAVDNYKNYSSIVQQSDSSGLAINAKADVYLLFEGSHNMHREQDSYNYQIRVLADDNRCSVVLKNYINIKPNSQLLSSKSARMQYLKKLDVSGRRKKILTQYAEEEYTQLDTQASNIFKQIEQSLN